MPSVPLIILEKFLSVKIFFYYYPAEVWISEYGKLYAKYEYQDEIECFSDIFALIERELKKCTIDSVAMKTVEALDNKL